MRLNVGLVEDEDEGKTGFVQDPVERGVSLQFRFQRDSSTHRAGSTHEQAYNMLLMNVLGDVVLGVSITYATQVGMELAMDSVMIDPEADQVKISIWPGVSRRM
jgi:hypothetical protein